MLPVAHMQKPLWNELKLDDLTSTADITMPERVSFEIPSTEPWWWFYMRWPHWRSYSFAKLVPNLSNFKEIWACNSTQYNCNTASTLKCARDCHTGNYYRANLLVRKWPFLFSPYYFSMKCGEADVATFAVVQTFLWQGSCRRLWPWQVELEWCKFSAPDHLISNLYLKRDLFVCLTELFNMPGPRRCTGNACCESDEGLLVGYMT